MKKSRSVKKVDTMINEARDDGEEKKKTLLRERRGKGQGEGK